MLILVCDFLTLALASCRHFCFRLFLGNQAENRSGSF